MIFQLVQQMAFLLLIVYLFSKSPAFKPLTGEILLFKHKLFLSLVFSLFAILGSWIGALGPGIVIDGSIIGIALAGLIAGPVSGMIVGLISGLHKYWLHDFSLVATIAGGGAFVQGLLSGLVHFYFLKKNQSERLFSPAPAFTVALLGLTIQGVSIALIAETTAFASCRTLPLGGLPAIIIISATTALAVMMIRDRRVMFDKVGALFSARALKIAERSLGIFGAGFNAVTARQLADIIYEETGVGAVAISDCKKNLAFVGKGADHHLPGFDIVSQQTKAAIRENRIIYADGVKEHFKCAISDNCPLSAALIVPLRVDNEVVGTIKLYEPKNKLFLKLNKTLGEGIAKLLSEQLLRYRYEEQKNLVVTSELRLIQAQVNPHFLFNALNTIVAVVRKDADQARDLLLHLSNYFRKNLKRSEALATLEEELDHVNSYLFIQKTRFGDKLQVEQEIDERLLKVRMPTFTLQPIVENAVKHGIANILGAGTVTIKASCSDQTLLITIEDDAGTYCEKLNSDGLGMNIVDKRIKNLFGSQYGTEISCVPDELTRVTVRIPYPDREVS